MSINQKPWLEMLLSCVNQPNADLVKRENIQCDVVMINKSDCNKSELLEVNGHQVKLFFTTDKGLAKSRNMAIRHSTADICVICDDDEYFYDGYPEMLIQAYADHPDADGIVFMIRNPQKKYPKNEFKLSYLSALRIASWQISFKRQRVVDNHLGFNELFGAGAPFPSGGEEHMFLQDCLKAGLRFYYVPIELGKMIETGESQWFAGFTRQYFINRGVVTAYQLGKIAATAYALYFAITKYALYRQDCGFLMALQSMLTGINSSKIKRPIRKLTHHEVY
jgi:glycosyltransferase involved in cell wall biosynthesis